MADGGRAACVVGWPIRHSRSPLIHGHWLEQHRIDGVYRREAVRPEDFPAFVASLADRGYVGANVTQPHKEAALTLSEPDTRARAVGAANTLWLDQGRLRSTNTDVEGALDSLDASAPGWDKEVENAVVLGAGGSARAVVFGLLERGVERVHVANRTLARADALRQRFGPRLVPTRWTELPRALAGARVVANATNLGMTGHPPLEIDLGRVRDDAVVAEVVYVPLRTALLTQAEERGLRFSDGLGMLLHQAGRGFGLWFGVRPEVTRGLRALVEAELLKEDTMPPDPGEAHRR